MPVQFVYRIFEEIVKIPSKFTRFQWRLRVFPLITVCTLLLSACGSSYNVLFNDRVVYTPNPLPERGTLVDDPNLQGCINQILLSSETSTPESITLLACPNADIQTLRGIERLENLEQLDLSDNRISDLAPLSNLQNLRLVSMRNNNIRNINPLMGLPILRFVSLTGNDNIPCRQLNNMESKIGNSLTRPLACNN